MTTVATTNPQEAKAAPNPQEAKVAENPQDAFAALSKAAERGAAPEPHPELNGFLLRMSDKTTDPMYLVVNGYRRLVPDDATSNNLFTNPTITKEPLLNLIAKGPDLTKGAMLIKTKGGGDGRWFLLTDQRKMWIVNINVFDRYQFDRNKVKELDKIVIDSIVEGDNIVGPTPA